MYIFFLLPILVASLRASDEPRVPVAPGQHGALAYVDSPPYPFRQDSPPLALVEEDVHDGIRDTSLPIQKRTPQGMIRKKVRHTVSSNGNQVHKYPLDSAVIRPGYFVYTTWFRGSKYTYGDKRQIFIDTEGYYQEVLDTTRGTGFGYRIDLKTIKQDKDAGSIDHVCESHTPSYALQYACGLLTFSLQGRVLP